MLLVLGAGFAATSGQFDCVRSGFAIASAVSLAVSLGFSIYLKILKPEQIWYGGRAVAESVKSMAWRYMMDADPYPVDLVPADAAQKFVAELKSIVKERQQLAFGLGGEFAEEPQITPRMQQLRSSTLEQRRGSYVAERISDQRRWYGGQAESNRSKANIYFALIVLSQFLGLFAAFMLITHPQSNLKFTGLFTSLAGALIAWLQIKQHKEQAQSYSIAELELGFVQQEAQYIADERALSDFVGDAENAISREHTLWVARRDRI
jgi:SMODS and SLOG-associating 2TM effector domain 1/SMODS and SLOG-associating 2TM effector domain 3